MKKFFKFLLTILMISAAIMFGLLVLWIIASAFVVRYIFKEKDNYDNIGDFFKEIKNVLAVIMVVILLVVTPVIFIKSTKEYNEELKEQQKQEAILEKQKQEEEEIEAKKKERSQVLNAKSKFKKDIKNGIDPDEAGMLTEKEIEQYNITDGEITKFNNDREKAIISYEEDQLGRKFKRLAEEYVMENISSTVSKFEVSPEYELNEDKTKFTVKGWYKGKNVYGASIRGDYQVEFDLSTGEISNIQIEKERVY
ncbi:MAG: DUF6056 family protein [Peptostreptococcaceae bacterium]